jgi:hypothetical protein
MKILAVVLAVAFFVVAALYWTGNLQVFASKPGPHHAHGILFAVLGVLSLVWLRFQGNASPSNVR